VSTVVDGVVYARSGEAFRRSGRYRPDGSVARAAGHAVRQNASAGVINVTSIMPKKEFSGSIDASYFEGNEWRIKAPSTCRWVRIGLRVSPFGAV
jgi:iron complex outermembrane receptor protein